METNSPLKPFGSQKIRRTTSVADLIPNRNRGLLSGSPSAFYKPIINFDNLNTKQGQPSSGQPPVTTTVPGLPPTTLIYSQSSSSTGHNNSNLHHYHVRLFNNHSMYSCRLSIYYRFLQLSHQVTIL
jgi:hypothetical protein